jgi:hypothetical protein
MAIEYEIIKEKRLVIAKGSGIVTIDDVMGHLEALVAPMKKLIDYSTIDGIIQSNEEIITIARKKETLKSRFAGEKCAFVSPEDLSFGIARVHEALIENAGIITAVFRRIEDALKWLDVESETNFK